MNQDDEEKPNRWRNTRIKMEAINKVFKQPTSTCTESNEDDVIDLTASPTQQSANEPAKKKQNFIQH